MHKVFVYGTLKRGHGNHRLLEGSVFLGRDTLRTPGHFVSLGGFPGLVRTRDDLVQCTRAVPGRQVGGEVYAVDDATLARLDRLEGHPQFYERREVIVSGGMDGQTAWVYTLPASYATRPEVETMFWEPTHEETAWANAVAL
jgi:gamma-glutamylaminecyclotransferase